MADDIPKRGGGRPLKHPSEGTSPTMTFRARPGLKAALHAASAASGSSVSEEIEKRLERSFANDEMRSILREELAAVALEIAHGPTVIDSRTDKEFLASSLRQFHVAGKIHG